MYSLLFKQLWAGFFVTGEMILIAEAQLMQVKSMGFGNAETLFICLFETQPHSLFNLLLCLSVLMIYMVITLTLPKPGRHLLVSFYW